LLLWHDEGMANLVNEAAGGSRERQRTFLPSAELWDGHESIAEHAGGRADRSDNRKKIKRVLRDLGLEQIRVGIATPRTSMWVKAFKTRAEMGNVDLSLH
jgi:hypothetical protein